MERFSIGLSQVSTWLSTFCRTWVKSRAFIFTFLVLLGLLGLCGLAEASPTTVRLEVTGLGVNDGNPNSPFGLALGSALTAGQPYKILITARDNDTDNNAQPVNNITFDLAISSGTLTGFSWLVTGDIDDAVFTNSVAGVDNPGQVSTDTFSGHQIPTQTLINAGFATPLPIAVIYFTAGSAGSSVNVNLDSNPYVSGFATDNSHYGINGTSYNLNQGQGLSFVASVSGGVTPTSTATVTRTATFTSTATYTATRTATATATRTNTATFTPTNVVTLTPTATATATSTRAATATSTPTATNVATFTATSTRTATPTSSATATNTATATATRASTATATATFTPTNVVTFTATSTRTATPTSSATPIITLTFTSTPTRTQTPTASPSRTSTPSASITQTPTSTGTPTVTRTPTMTPTRSATPTITSTPAALLSLSGHVTYEGLGLGGVIIDGGSLGSKVTDLSGYYVFNNVASGTAFALIPSRGNYAMIPDSTCGTIQGNTVVNFKALLANKVYPILECVSNKGSGNYTAKFGYQSTNDAVVSLPVGSANRFGPGSRDRGQPTVFMPGRVVNSFAIDFNGKALSWKLDGTSVSASKDSPACCVGVLDQCGVCNGNGSSCLSCSGGQAGYSVSELRVITDKQVQPFRQAKRASKRISPEARAQARHLARKAERLGNSNEVIGQSMLELMGNCQGADSCRAQGLCVMSDEYKKNSHALVGLARSLQRLVATEPGTLSAHAGDNLSGQAEELDRVNINVLISLPAIQNACGG